MPSLDINFLLQLKDDYKKFFSFVETGTLYGETIFAMEPFFNSLYTIELSEKYHSLTKSKYNGNKINFLLGDSSIVLESLLPKMKENTIFFLDGHWSSGDTAKGDKDCPLYEEINHINSLFKNEAIIIIDDCRLFGLSKLTGNNEDWSQINENNIVKILENRIHQKYYLDSNISKNDRLIIHIKRIV